MVSSNAVHLALRARFEAVNGIPSSANRAFENKDFKPTDGQIYIEEEFVPASAVLPGLSRGPVVAFGIYILKVYGIAKTGATAIRAIVDAILAAFPPGYTFAQLANGDSIRIRGNPAPSSGQILPQDDGRAVCTITIPFRCQSIAQPS